MAEGGCELGELLISRAALEARVAELGAAISRDYEGRDPILIGVLTSSAIFLADLARAVSIPSEFDFIAISSYARERAVGDGIRGGVRFEKDLASSVEGRHAIVVEDIVDTGLTLQYILRTLWAREAASVAVCSLLDRPHRRIADVPIAYRGFEIPDRFVVGYGLDHRGLHRELPEIFVHEHATSGLVDH